MTGTKAVLLDSGGVLIRPVSGDWFPPPAFEAVLARAGVDWDPACRPTVAQAAMRHVDGVPHVPDDTAEDTLLHRMYEVMLQAAGIEAELAADMVDHHRNESFVETLPWTEPVLVALRDRGLQTIIVSDAWPSLRRFYRHLRLDHLVDAMVISSEEGVTKPDPHLYTKALSIAGCSPSEAVFVDDWADNVLGAERLGIRGFRLRPAGAEPSTEVHDLDDLRELLYLLETGSNQSGPVPPWV